MHTGEGHYSSKGNTLVLNRRDELEESPQAMWDMARTLREAMRHSSNAPLIMFDPIEVSIMGNVCKALGSMLLA